MNGSDGGTRVGTDLTGVPETMLQTVYARARESRKADRCIDDRKSVEIVDSLDYDFSEAEKDTAMRDGVVARTLVLDRLVGEFLESRPGIAVVNMACGLDMRCYRMTGRFGTWYNLDLPETMEVRRRFVSETEEIRQISASAVTDGWTSCIPEDTDSALVIIEGLSMYLSEQQVKDMLAVIRDRFSDATVMIEIMNPSVARHVKEKSIEGSHAKFAFGAKDGSVLADMVPGYRHVKDVSLCEGMKTFKRGYGLLSRIPMVRNISNKIAVLEHR